MCNDFTIRNDAGWQKVREAASSIAMGLSNNRDPMEAKFANYTTEWLTIDQNCYQQNIITIDRTEWLSIEQNGYQQNRMAIDRSEGYQQKRIAMDRTEWQSLEHNDY